MRHSTKEQKREVRILPEEIVEILKNINKNLEYLNQKQNLPKLIYAKEIAENYPVNVNKATKFCKKFGTNFGGYCIEQDKFKEILQTQGAEILTRI